VVKGPGVKSSLSSALQARVDFVEDRAELSDAIDHVMGAGFRELTACADEALFFFRLQKAVILGLGEADGVTGAGDSDGPGAGVKPFPDVGGRIADLGYRGHGINAKPFGALEHHEGMGTPFANLSGREAAIGHVAFARGGIKQHVEHLARVAGGGTDLETASLQTGHRFGYAGNDGGVIHQAGKLQGNESGIHLIYVGIGGSRAVLLRPRFANARQGENAADMFLFRQAHVAPALLLAELDAAGREEVLHGARRRHAAEIDRGAGPVEHNGFQTLGAGWTRKKCVVDSSHH